MNAADLAALLPASGPERIARFAAVRFEAAGSVAEVADARSEHVVADGAGFEGEDVAPTAASVFFGSTVTA